MLLSGYRFALATCVCLVLGACQSPTRATPPQTTPTADEARDFIAGVNDRIRAEYAEVTAAQWIAETYISRDSELVAAKASERSLRRIAEDLQQAQRYSGVKDLDPQTRRALQLLAQQTAMPAPRDAARLAQLSALASRLNAAYGSARACRDERRPETCRNFDQLSQIMAQQRDWDTALDAWRDWHDAARGSRDDYNRFVGLINEGARDMGYADAGELWRSGYDMPAAQLRAQTDRLWLQVKPLYDALQCHVRDRLAARYGSRMPDDGTIPAHITGNMWAQDWLALYPLLQPYPDTAPLDVDARLAREGYTPERMARGAEEFYVSLGFPPLPASFYANSQFTRPRDRDVVCFGSAWDLDLAGDVRLKMCGQPTEEDLRTIYHEMGHIYYFLAYNPLPPLFQASANDGFHEAVGDTVQLNVTPAYLARIGLTAPPTVDTRGLLNAQMKFALDKIAVLPFVRLVDEWRWGVFDGSIKPDAYNAAWWALRKKYQGVAPVEARGEENFDPGAKYHIPGNTPYLRYFLSHILQFQFQRALCRTAGHEGPLHECSIYGSKAAGAKFWAMLEKGSSQPWQDTLKELTGTGEMDASAILDYFAPLHAWLKQQNEGRRCGWN
jgi:peptidyl-dipeptidase A